MRRGRSQRTGGLGNIYPSRSDMKADIIKEKLAAGVKIRFLVMDPNSPYLKEREREERVLCDSIKRTIEDLEDWIRKLNKENRKNNIQLKYYNALPLDYYNRIDNVVYMGPYWYGRTSQYTVSYRFKGDSEGFSLYAKYFEELWNNKDLTVDALSRKKALP